MEQPTRRASTSTERRGRIEKEKKRERERERGGSERRGGESGVREKEALVAVFMHADR